MKTREGTNPSALGARIYTYLYIDKGPVHDRTEYLAGLVAIVAGAFAAGLSWPALRSAHYKNLCRETHPTVCGILTKRFERLTVHFSRLLL
jgi:hypothetical protein